MKIAHFYDGIYIKGGVGGYVQSLAKLQIAAGDEVLYFETEPTVPSGDGARPVLVKSNQDLFEKCQDMRVDILHLHTYPLSLPPAGLNTVYTVHEHSAHCMSGSLFLKNRGIPCPRTYDLVGCAWGHLRDHCGSVRPWQFIANVRRAHLLKMLLPQIKIVCVGEFLRSRMIKAGYPGENIGVIPNFTDVDVPLVEMSLTGTPQFLFLGRLERLKGVEWLLRSFREVKTPAILNIGGEGQEEPALRALAKELEIEDRVKFLGWIDRDTKIKLLRSARALIVPSIWHETFGLVAIEAAACARPVIVSNAGELPYLVGDGREGIVVEPGNIQRLGEAIDELARDPEKARQMGLDNLRKCRLLYTPEAHKRRLDEVYASFG